MTEQEIKAVLTAQAHIRRVGRILPSKSCNAASARLR